MSMSSVRAHLTIDSDKVDVSPCRYICIFNCNYGGNAHHCSLLNNKIRNIGYWYTWLVNPVGGEKIALGFGDIWV
jgi:hypothetical protein